MTTLTELEALADAATPGPWRYYEWRSHTCQVVTEDGDSITSTRYGSIADHQFIAAANPATIKQLIALCRQQHEALEEARSVREGLIKWRQKAWPGIDQRLVIDRDYPHIPKALAAFERFDKGEK